MSREDLHPEPSRIYVSLRALQLGHRTHPRRVGARVVEPRGALYEEAGGVNLGLDVGKRVSERLEFTDRPPELVAGLGVGKRLVDRRLRGADIATADEDALERQP